MSDKLRGFRVVKEGDNITPPPDSDQWAAACAVARKAGATSGVLIYGTKEGVGFESIDATWWMLRGLMEEGIDSLQGMGNGE